MIMLNLGYPFHGPLYKFKSKINKNIQTKVRGEFMNCFFDVKSQIEVSGYLQAVSDDGKAALYRTENTLYIYHFDGNQIVDQQYPLPEYIGKPKEFYDEEHPFPDYKIKVIGERIVIYILVKPSLLKVEFASYKSPEATHQIRNLSSNILDFAIDPLDHSLVVLTDDSIYFIFGQSEGPLQYHPQNPTISGKIYLSETDAGKEYYLFYLQENQPTQLEIHKLLQAQTFSFVSGITITISDERDYDIFSRISYNRQDKIFAITNDHIDEENTRYHVSFFINEDIEVMDRTGGSSLREFHSFMKDRNTMVFGGHYKEGDDLYLAKICTIDYGIEGKMITFQEDSEKCEDGFYDRVSSWSLAGQSYLLTHIDHALLIRKQLDESELAILEGRTFSGRMANTLMVQEHNQLKYVQWRQKEEEKNDSTVYIPVVPPEDNTTEENTTSPIIQRIDHNSTDFVIPLSTFVILVVILGLLLVSTIILAVCLCKKYTSTSSVPLPLNTQKNANQSVESVAKADNIAL